jgi:glycosyltransferase involved in cell wall biosynthesis
MPAKAGPHALLRPFRQIPIARTRSGCFNPLISRAKILDVGPLQQPSVTATRHQRVAIVHDWLVVFGGAERVLRELLAMFPQADLFAVCDFLSDEDRAKLGGKRAKTTFIQRLPRARTKYRAYLPLMPIAIEQLDMSGYDLVLSSSHAVAKGILTGPDQRHICYCYTPIRYAWDLQHQYLAQSGLTRGVKSLIARLTLHYIRQWDLRTANGVDEFIAISHYIARRIKKVYGRESQVIYPPVDIDAFPLRRDKEDFYLTASRLVPYKRVDLIVEAFAQMPDKRLIVIGDGPEMPKLRALAGPNVTLLGYQPDAILRDHLQRARAFIFAAEEDFGILPVEAQACGTPVIAFAKGGAAETVTSLDHPSDHPPSGVFFAAQSTDSIAGAIAAFESRHAEISAATCRANATNFSVETFRRAIENLVRDTRIGAFGGI